MIEGIPRISVLVITYNQEDVISRAIDSLLLQRDYIYEICVSDDCSKDRTWDILQDYSAKHPGLFVLNRNDPNVGIFENIEKTWTMPTGDIIYQLSGDDEAGKDWLRNVVSFIKQKKIDYRKESFCIYGDFECIYPNNDSYIFKNEAVLSGIDIVKLAVRKFIVARGACYSINVMKKFQNVSIGKSYKAEGAQDRQLQVFSKTNYYIPSIANIYYSNIGVSSKMNSSDLRIVMDDGVRYNKKILEQLGYRIDKQDNYYFRYYIEKQTFLQSFSLMALIKTLFLFFRSFDMSIGWRSFRFKLYLYRLLRRLPHSKRINWNIGF